jgi:hypothetical protein
MWHRARAMGCTPICLPLRLARVPQVGTTAWRAMRSVHLRKLKVSGANSRPPDVETTLRRIRPAPSKPDNKLSEDIVTFGMRALGTSPPPCQPLLYVVQALLQERPR